MKDLLFRDDQSLIGSNWYKLPKKLFVIPFILSFLGLFAIYSLVGTEYSIGLFLKHFIYLIISFLILIYPGFVAATATFSNDVNIPTLSTVIAAVELFAYATVNF